MTDQLTKAIDWWLGDMVDRDRKAREAAAADIRANGTAWAASEIARLRERVAQLEAANRRRALADDGATQAEADRHNEMSRRRF